MGPLLTWILVLALALSQIGCGNVFVGGAVNLQTMSGTVSIVRLTIVSDNGGASVQVTAVTLLTNDMSSSATFCGDQRSQFPMNQFVKASFTFGQPCSTLVTIVPGRT